MTDNRQKIRQESVAAEYVLGTMDLQTRDEFEQRLKSDLTLQAEVTAWEERMNPMLDMVEPVEPPPAVWEQIQQRIDPQPEKQKASLWESLGFWRNMGMIAASMVLALGLTIFSIQNEPAMDSVMMVTNQQSKVQWVVGSTQKSDMLEIRAIAPPDLPEGKVCQLWMETRDGKLMPVGVLPHTGTANIKAPAHLQQNRSFKVSIESLKSLPKEKPTGDFVFEGELTRI